MSVCLYSERNTDTISSIKSAPMDTLQTQYLCITSFYYFLIFLFLIIVTQELYVLIFANTGKK